MLNSLLAHRLMRWHGADVPAGAARGLLVVGSLGAALVLAFFAVGELGAVGGAAAVTAWADGGWTVCGLAALLGCLIAARRDPAARRAWLLFTAGCATWVGGQMAWNYDLLVAHQPAPFPSLGDAGWLGFVPWCAAGLCALPRPRAAIPAVLSLVLDVAIVGLAFSLIGLAAIQPLRAGASSLTPAALVAVGYPVTYLTLGLVAFLLMVRLPHLAATRSMALLLAGLLCEGVGFVAWAPLLLRNAYRTGTALDLVWMAGLLAIALAGLSWQPERRANWSAETIALTVTRVALGLVPTALGLSVALITPHLTRGMAYAPSGPGQSFLIVLIALRQGAAMVADARMYVDKSGTAHDTLLHRAAADLLGETTLGILEGLVTAVDAKDRYTREHSLDVTRYALLLAEALGLSDAERRTLAIAGPLHDVGKIAVPDRVLRKPGRLSAEEYALIRTHVTYGVAIVRGMLDDTAVIEAIAHHHERYDGTGYPAGLPGAETPLLGRIMQIADAVSAMTLDRPYRCGLSAERVVAQLRLGAGTQFDPALVEPFIAAFCKERARPQRVGSVALPTAQLQEAS